MSLTRTCDFCGRPHDTLRYTLTHKVRWADGSKHTQSSGGVDMCRTDWSRICKPRMKSVSPDDWYQHGAQSCDRCKVQRDVTRYSVKKSVRVGTKVTDIAGGGLSLCRECWTSVARPRMRLLRQRQEHADLADMVQVTSGGVPRALRTSHTKR